MGRGVAGGVGLGARNSVETAVDDTRRGAAAVRDGETGGATELLNEASGGFDSVSNRLGAVWLLPARMVPGVAQNPHAARALHDALGAMEFHQNTFAVFGMLKDKDIDAVIEIIKDRIDFWFVAGLDALAGERGAPVDMLAGKLEAHGVGESVSRHVSVAMAYAAARERAGQNDRILVFGSFYTVAEILRLARTA